MTGPTGGQEEYPGLVATALALRRAVDRALDGAPRVTLLFSGGVDSSLLAHLVGAVRPTTLLVVGSEGARDRVAAREAAALLSGTLREERLGREDLRGTRDRFRAELEGLREPALSVALSAATALERARDLRVLWGQGADELFYGYARYRSLPPDEVRDRAARDLDRLVTEENPRCKRIARHLGRELRAPYLDAEFRHVVGRYPPPLPSRSVAKPGLRALARFVGLPVALADRPKRAFQYGSGVRRFVEQEDRARSTPG